MNRQSQDHSDREHRHSQNPNHAKEGHHQAKNHTQNQNGRQSQDPQNHPHSHNQNPLKERKSQDKSHNQNGGRKSRKSLEDYNYEFHSDVLDNFRLSEDVQEKLITSNKSHKVAFLSGSERQYYPEAPGHSKFALEFSSNLADPTLPPPQYYVSPFADRLTKPVSKKGYGIGGLSGPRFAPQHIQKGPAPNQYQKHVKELLTRQHRFPPSVWINYGLLGPNDKIWDAKVGRKLFSLWGKCHQIKVGFGTTTSQQRFGKEPRWNLVGPGNYAYPQLQLDRPCVHNAFLTGPTKFNAPTKLHCSYGPPQNCLECETQLMGDKDYYRSRYAMKPIPFRSIIENTEEHILQALKEVNKRVETPENIKARRVLLCRSCYCKALRGDSRFWKTRAEVLRLFEKTRHCGYIHAHNGIPEYTMKASCYWTSRLARKEAILSRHYLDKCEKRIKERKQKYQA